MTIDLWVWTWSRLLIRLIQRPMGGLSLPLLLPHPFLSPWDFLSYPVDTTAF